MDWKAAIFDVDGTLIDSVDLHAKAWQEALAHFGKQVPFPDIRQQIGKGGDQLRPVFLSPQENKRFGEDLEKFRGQLFKDRYLPQVHRFPAVPELFQKLKEQGIRVALATSSKGNELENYKRIAGIEDFVDHDTSSDDAQRSKPHPDVFQAALDKLKLKPEAGVVAIGDTPYDAEAGVKAGLRVVGVLSGGFPAEQLTGAGCAALFRDPADILARLEDLRRRVEQGAPVPATRR